MLGRTLQTLEFEQPLKLSSANSSVGTDCRKSIIATINTTVKDTWSNSSQVSVRGYSMAMADPLTWPLSTEFHRIAVLRRRRGYDFRRSILYMQTRSKPVQPLCSPCSGFGFGFDSESSEDAIKLVQRVVTGRNSNM